MRKCFHYNEDSRIAVSTSDVGMGNYKDGGGLSARRSARLTSSRSQRRECEIGGGGQPVASSQTREARIQASGLSAILHTARAWAGEDRALPARPRGVGYGLNVVTHGFGRAATRFNADGRTRSGDDESKAHDRGVDGHLKASKSFGSSGQLSSTECEQAPDAEFELDGEGAIRKGKIRSRGALLQRRLHGTRAARRYATTKLIGKSGSRAAWSVMRPFCRGGLARATLGGSGHRVRLLPRDAAARQVKEEMETTIVHGGIKAGGKHGAAQRQHIPRHRERTRPASHILYPGVAPLKPEVPTKLRSITMVRARVRHDTRSAHAGFKRSHCGEEDYGEARHVRAVGVKALCASRLSLRPTAMKTPRAREAFGEGWNPQSSMQTGNKTSARLPPRREREGYRDRRARTPAGERSVALDEMRIAAAWCRGRGRTSAARKFVDFERPSNSRRAPKNAQNKQDGLRYDPEAKKATVRARMRMASRAAGEEGFAQPSTKLEPFRVAPPRGRDGWTLAREGGVWKKGESLGGWPPRANDDRVAEEKGVETGGDVAAAQTHLGLSLIPYRTVARIRSEHDEGMRLRVQEVPLVKSPGRCGTRRALWPSYSARAELPDAARCWAGSRYQTRRGAYLIRARRDSQSSHAEWNAWTIYQARYEKGFLLFQSSLRSFQKATPSQTPEWGRVRVSEFTTKPLKSDAPAAPIHGAAVMPVLLVISSPRTTRHLAATAGYVYKRIHPGPHSISIGGAPSPPLRHVHVRKFEFPLLRLSGACLALHIQRAVGLFSTPSHCVELCMAACAEYVPQRLGLIGARYSPPPSQSRAGILNLACDLAPAVRVGVRRNADIPLPAFTPAPAPCDLARASGTPRRWGAARASVRTVDEGAARAGADGCDRARASVEAHKNLSESDSVDEAGTKFVRFDEA
ncbi:hypothetical protein FB451DRAFT_1358857 [Mycena latifolia]|nr:hypothetical protein FB451DRAFT_1358857 [Mycena latifolia]